MGSWVGEWLCGWVVGWVGGRTLIIKLTSAQLRFAMLQMGLWLSLAILVNSLDLNLDLGLWLKVCQLQNLQYSLITIEFNDFMLFDFGFIMINVNGAFFSIFLEPF